MAFHYCDIFGSLYSIAGSRADYTFFVLGHLHMRIVVFIIMRLKIYEQWSWVGVSKHVCLFCIAGVGEVVKFNFCEGV